MAKDSASASPADEARVHPLDALATIGCVYLALITIGFAAFRYLAVLPAGAKRNQDVTFFTSTNVVSLTGFEHVNALIANYPTLGLIFVAILGIASACTALIGGGYLLARAMRLNISLASLAIYSLVIVLLPAAISSIAGVFNGASASVGLGILARLFPSGGPLAVIIGVGCFGLLGVMPLAQFLRAKSSADSNRSDYLLTLIAAAAVLVLAGAVALIACGSPWRAALMQSLALRGFGNEAGPPLLASPAMPWVTMALSLLGTAPASVAGGLSLLPIVIAIRGGIDAIHGRAVDPLLGVALAWIAIFVSGFALFAVALASTAAALPGERMLMLVSSAISNVGISYEPVGVVGPSLFALSAAMLFGRLLPFVMLAWMACVAERPSRSS